MYSRPDWRSEYWAGTDRRPPRLGPLRRCETSGRPPARGTSYSPRSLLPRRNPGSSTSAAPARSSPRPAALVSESIVLYARRSRLEDEIVHWIFTECKSVTGKSFQTMRNRFFSNEFIFQLTIKLWRCLVFHEEIKNSRVLPDRRTAALRVLML